ncbi:MAG: hypothetical protein WBQ50_17050, partial [Nocardioides sp.]
SGYGGSVAALAPLERALTDAGREVVVMTPVGSGTGDLAAQAEALDDIARATLADLDASSVDVVGYSAGGVVARSWVRDHGGDEVARRVLTLGSPHHGTRVAELAGNLFGDCAAACRQLVPDSDFLRALNAGDETPAGPAYISVWTSSDEIVVPPDSARLDGALGLVVQDFCPDARTRHGGLPGSPVVLATLASALGPDAPGEPTVEDCR